MNSERNLNVLFSASEMAPYAKTGGLADVVSSLPKELINLGIDARVVIPKYGFIDDDKYKLIEMPDRLKFTMSGYNYEVKVKYHKSSDGLMTYFLEHDGLLSRNDIYGYEDDGYRFAFFNKASIELTRFLGFKPDIFHCHDWHVGLIPVYLKTIYRNDPFLKDTATIFTIHNLGYQGIFSKGLLPYIEISWEEFKAEKLEFWGNINFIKAGIAYSDIINTVSKEYSKEIQSPEQGQQLDNLLRSKANDLFGIINGIDYNEWNPSTDENIAVRYDLSSIYKKVENKIALQKEFGLPQNDQIPLLGFVSRLTYQKGPDLIAESAFEIISMGAQLVLLGTGDDYYRNIFQKLANDFPNNVKINASFNDSLARRIYAGSDMFLMPSRYEPCGLSQLISMRYGTIPIVRRTGGLADTVHEYDSASGNGTGFVFNDESPMDLISAVRRAIDVYYGNKSWQNIIANAMKSDFSWGNSAKEYADLYRRAIQKHEIG
ncbi:MAG: glycogen synthase GlgA [Candidatus Poribacteria bacterium]